MVGRLYDDWIIKKRTVGRRENRESRRKKKKQNDVMSRIIKISGDFWSLRCRIESIR